MDKNRKTLEEINRWCTPNSLLIIVKDGTLKRIHCPFRVLTIQVNRVAQLNQVVTVEAVRLSDDLLLLYVIQKTALPYHYFIIIL